VSISSKTKQEVRKRAGFACEYCGVSESDVGGELTIDHYQPQSANGSDELENLIYACYRCNLYKSDYWTTDSEFPRLWNPRNEAFDEHFWLSRNGKIYAITETAEFTVKRLRLNRVPLVKHRQRKTELIADYEFIEHLQNAAKLLAQTNKEQANLLEEQQKLLSEQQQLLKILLNIEKSK
jgi:hypothetical protein